MQTVGISRSGIETVQVTHRRVIVMPRWGVRNVIVQEMAITLPRVRFLEGQPADGGPDAH